MMHMIPEKKTPSSSVSGIPPRSVLVSMRRINHTFPYSNRKIPASVVAPIQSLKGYLTRDLWLIQVRLRTILQ